MEKKEKGRRKKGRKKKKKGKRKDETLLEKIRLPRQPTSITSLVWEGETLDISELTAMPGTPHQTDPAAAVG